MGMFKMITGAVGGAIGGMPRWMLYVIAALAIAAAVWAFTSKVANSHRLDECHDNTAKLQSKLSAAQRQIADLQASKANLETALSDQNTQIEKLRADAAEASKQAADAADTHRNAPQRDVSDDVSPAAVNKQVRQRIQELSQ
ncbi:hypothetical protein V5738_10960 [Salinisphaera sp. SPP-AMP-43]|uniref:hypothetical protein n=1 Tax=Salinisphaera sp. SPP-AMP-43 TaxID=3121288 RepID=UPI003C6DF5B3